MRRTGLARGQGMKLAVSSAPKARKVFVSRPRAGRRAPRCPQAAHLPCAKWSFWWVTFREQTWVTSRECRSSQPSFAGVPTVATTPHYAWQANNPVNPGNSTDNSAVWISYADTGYGGTQFQPTMGTPPGCDGFRYVS